MAGILGTAIAQEVEATPVPVVVADEGRMERNRQLLRQNYVAYDEEGNFKYSETKTPIMHSIRWTGHDGTRFKLEGFPRIESAHRDYIIAAFPPDTNGAWYKREHYTEQFVASIGEDNFNDYLKSQCLAFEFDYYAGNLTRPT
jgi:hypothetical protein